MKNILKDYFPMIQEKNEIKEYILGNYALKKTWSKWPLSWQQTFLNWCSGAKGVKILYDSFFKEVMNPEYTPERLNSLLSALLGRNVRVLNVLPNDSTRIADEQSLVIMDIVVELEDVGIANVEVQKLGYAFTGQRAACYSADLLLRQYKRVRGEKGDQFRYKDIKPVYTIILMETSAGEFKQMPECYVHRIEPKSDTGIELELLQTFIFIPLDIFKKKYHNKGITNKLDAWLVFLSMDEPSDIINLITLYPEFKSMYETIYQMCQNVERVMSMFSEELAILDRNTVTYMIDEMQNELDEKVKIIDEKVKILDKQDETIKEKNKEIKEKDEEIKVKDEEIKEKDEEIKVKDEEIKEKDEEIKEKDEEIKEKDEEIKEKDEEIKEKDERIKDLEKQMEVLKQQLEKQQVAKEN